MKKFCVFLSILTLTFILFGCENSVSGDIVTTTTQTTTAATTITTTLLTTTTQTEENVSSDLSTSDTGESTASTENNTAVSASTAKTTTTVLGKTTTTRTTKTTVKTTETTESFPAYYITTTSTTSTTLPTTTTTTVWDTTSSRHVHRFSLATCTTPPTCSCGETKGKPLGHSWQDATCSSPETCLYCGEKRGEPLEHIYEEEIEREATCLDYGMRVVVCQRCRDEKERKAIPVKEHNLVRKPYPNCDYYHIYKDTCTYCLRSWYTPDDAEEHTYEQEFGEGTADSHVVILHCTICDHTVESALPHTWSSWYSEEDPAISIRVCDVCQYEQRKNTADINYEKELVLNEVFELVNRQRAINNLQPLIYLSDAQEAADIRANELVLAYDSGHKRPDGRECFTVFSEITPPITYRRAGENIAMGQETPGEVMNDWMNSSGHRANILGDFTHIIVGYQDGRWVQLFLKLY